MSLVSCKIYVSRVLLLQLCYASLTDTCTMVYLSLCLMFQQYVCLITMFEIRNVYRCTMHTIYTPEFNVMQNIYVSRLFCFVLLLLLLFFFFFWQTPAIQCMVYVYLCLMFLQYFWLLNIFLITDSKQYLGMRNAYIYRSTNLVQCKNICI